MDEKKPRSDNSKPKVRLGAILAGILVLVVVGWLVFHDDSSSDSADDEPAAAGVERLREIAGEKGSPVYWAGPQEDAELEVTTAEGNERVYVRYLTGDAEPGDPRADFLTVGSYSFPDAAEALRKQAQQPGGVLKAGAGGTTIYFSRKRPQSVYLAYPGVDVEVEVYDPDPQRALELVTEGEIVPVD